MRTKLNGNNQPQSLSFPKNRSTYNINENYLQRLGFEKNEVLSGINEWVYRYYKPSKQCNGIELVFIRDFCILSVEEFWLNRSNGTEKVSNTIVGKFRIYSDEDLQFIFSRNIRLNYLFNITRRNV